MDDLYRNAWTSSIDHDEDITGINPSPWTATKSPVEIHDHEADLAAPSWSTGADIRWNEPSEAGGFSWTQTDPDLAWTSTTTYDDMKLGQASEQTMSGTEAQEKIEDAEERGEEAEIAVPVTVPTSASMEVEETEHMSPVLGFATPSKLSPVATPPYPPPSPDGFGTFESAIEATTSTPSFAQDDLAADAWGSPWTSAPGAADRSTQDTVDDWEVAKEQKARQDRKVVSQC